MILGIIEKTPEERLDYDTDLSRWLTAGDIVDSVATSIDDTTTVTVDETALTDTRVKVWLTGGAAGEGGTLTLLVTTAQGRIKELCYRLRVKDC